MNLAPQRQFLDRTPSLVWIVAALALHSAACSSTVMPFDQHVRVNDRNAVLFFVDGLDTRRLAELDDAGRIPNIHTNLVAGGLQFTNATDCFPSVTYSNAVSLMTGLYPGHHGIIANSWFDRRDRRYEDYVSAFTYLNVDADYKARTVYEILAPEVTASAQCAAARGATWRFQAPLTNGLDWSTGNYESVDRRVGSRVRDIVRRARRARNWPVFQTYYFPGVDKVAHTDGVESDRYADAVVNADTQIGTIISTIESVVGPGRTYYCLIADHGQMNCAHDRDLDLASLLRDRTGLNVCQATHRGVSDKADIILIPGRRHAVIHVRGTSGWKEPADESSIRRVVNALAQASDSNAALHAERQPISGIRCVYSRLDGNRVCVLDATGERIVARDAESSVLVAAHDVSTFDRELTTLFQSPRAGDVLVFADDVWVFESKDCGGHGGASPRERQIPFFLKGPGIPAGTRCGAPVGIIDVMPTLLDLLGRKDRLPGNLDGHSLIPIINAAAL